MKKTIATMALALVASMTPAMASAHGDGSVRPHFRVERTCDDTSVVVRDSKHYMAMSSRSYQYGYIFVNFYVEPGHYFLDARKPGRYKVSEAGQSASVVVKIKDC